jgi:DNA-binding beta-propeller fold protein YncE
MRRTVSGLCALASLVGCGDGGDTPPPGGTGATYRPHHAQTMLFGTTDNAEVVKVLPEADLALVVASKARKVTLVEVSQGTLREVETRALFPDDPSESELTHVAVAKDGAWAVLTRTQVTKDGDGATTGCAGSLVFIDARRGATFGAVLAEVPVGPMPDAVDVSPDGRWVVSANERDVVWGKCEGLEGLEGPSLSFLDVSGGPAAAVEVKRVMMTEDLEREPEQVVFARDSDLVVATLQDSHEVLFLRRTAALAAASPTEALGTLVTLPQNQIAQDAWPDGVVGFLDGGGREVFATAGEANDTLCLLDAAGTVLHTIEVTEAEVPADFPRDGSWGPLFRPDSVTAFQRGGKSYLAASLKASGAVGVWDVTDPGAPVKITVEKVGKDDPATRDQESTLGTEGISASDDGRFIITANEGESSVSLLVP